MNRIDDCPWHLAFWARIKKRLRPFLDIGSWILFILTLVPLYLINPPMLVTLVQWTAFAVALAGVAVMLCRVLLPMVDLGELYDRIRNGRGDTTDAIVFASVVALLGVLFLGLILWGKA